MSDPRDCILIVKPSDALTIAKSLSRVATNTAGADDIPVLSGWHGWGSLSLAFADEPTALWARIAEELHDALGETGFLAASETLHTSFFTPEPVAAALWRILLASGFTGGRVLDPGCGSGALLRACPVPDHIDYVGVEKHTLTGHVARLLNPSASVRIGELSSVPLVEESFDAAVANVPFSQTQRYGRALHLQFLDSMALAVRDGGYIVAIASSSVLDYAQQLPEKTRLVGAVRLPTGAFAQADTDVVADILVLKVDHGVKYQSPPDAPFRDSARAPGYRCQVSALWDAHPEWVAGTLEVGRGPHGGKVIVTGDTDDIDRAVDALCRTVEADPYTERDQTVPLPEWVEDATDDEGRLEGTIFLRDGLLYRITEGEEEPVRSTKELRALVELRDAAHELVTAEGEPFASDADLDPLRARARDLYEKYVTAFGPLNRCTQHVGDPDPETGECPITVRRPPMGGFAKDPTSWAVFALERFDIETQEARGADILYRRVNLPYTPPSSAETVHEALALSMAQYGRVVPDHVGKLVGLSGRDAMDALGDAVFFNPQERAWERASDYLSGQVRDKLTQARRHALHDAALERNVVALEAVQPEPLARGDIRISLGAPYVPTRIVVKFLERDLGCGWARIERESDGSWKVTASNPAPDKRTLYTTGRADLERIAGAALNSRVPVITDEVWDPDTRKYRSVRNHPQTAAAISAMERLTERFSLWVWEDKESSETVSHIYETRFNSFVPRIPDGSYLRFPDLAPGMSLWKNQTDFIDHALTAQRSLCAHAVGAGKTLTMIGLAVQLRRMGLARKPMITVPRHLIDQVAREARQAFPGRSFLIVGRDDLTGRRRRVFAARCATGDWDAVICTHEGFTSFALSPETERDELLRTRGHLRAQMSSYYTPRQLSRKMEKVSNKLSELRYRMGDTQQIFFDQLGIDFLAVDEADKFRRLPTFTRTEGFSLGESKRATDLRLKVEHLARCKPNAPVCALFTGTPWGNSLAETWVWQSFLQPDVLEHAGVSGFDDWAKTFVRFENRIEVSPDGSGFRSKVRPAVIQNLPELHKMFMQVADLLPPSELSTVRPDARRDIVAVPRSREVSDYMDELVVRAALLAQGGKVCKGEDNMLVICSDGRKVALDPALVGVTGDSRKIDAVAQRVARVYHERKYQRIDPESEALGILQLVLCDIGTPHKGVDTTYDRLRAKLVSLGVPRAMIKFVQDATTDRARDALFAQCRAGKVAVLMGSTPTVGIGTNVQRRLGALHHMDAPWRPSDIEQREGRALRHGNLHEVVDIITYVSEATFDAFMWETLTRKARFVAQLYTRHVSDREVDDLSESVLGFSHVKSIASGNPLLLQQAQAGAQLKKLRIQRSAAVAVTNTMRERLVRIGKELGHLDKMSEVLAQCDAANPQWRASVPVHIDADTWRMGNTGLYGDVDGVNVSACFDYWSAPVATMTYSLSKKSEKARLAWAGTQLRHWLDAVFTADALAARKDALRAEQAEITDAVENPSYPEDALIAEVQAQYDSLTAQIEDMVSSDEQSPDEEVA